MTRKTNFFHSHRETDAPALSVDGDEAVADAVPVEVSPDPVPAAPAVPAPASARRPWRANLSGPRWPRRRAAEGVR